MKTSNETRTENTSVITRKDLRKIFWKSLPFEISWNYVRQDHMGFAYSMTPVIEKLYQTKKKAMHIPQMVLAGKKGWLYEGIYEKPAG